MATDLETAIHSYWLCSLCWRGRMAKGDSRGPDTMGELIEEMSRLAWWRGQLGVVAANDLDCIIKDSKLPQREGSIHQFPKRERLTGAKASFVFMDDLYAGQ